MEVIAFVGPSGSGKSHRAIGVWPINIIAMPLLTMAF